MLGPWKACAFTPTASNDSRHAGTREAVQFREFRRVEAGGEGALAGFAGAGIVAVGVGGLGHQDPAADVVPQLQVLLGERQRLFGFLDRHVELRGVLRATGTKPRDILVRLVDKDGRLRQLQTRVQALLGNGNGPRILLVKVIPQLERGADEDDLD